MDGQVLRFEQPDPLKPRVKQRTPTSGRAQGILRRGEYLFHAGEILETPHLIIAGILKSYISDANGEECIIGFHMPGDVVGFEALLGRRTPYATLALDTTKVFPLQIDNPTGADLRNRPDLIPDMYREMLRLVHLLQMERSSTEGRLARFLMDYSELQRKRGCSRRSFVLPMARYELARYLGLAAETVSRVLGRFRDRGWLQVNSSCITILDPHSLWRAAGVKAKAETGETSDG